MPTLGPLRSLLLRLKLLIAMDALARMTTAALIMVAVQCAADYLFRLEWAARAAALGVMVGVVVALAVQWLFRPLLVPLTLFDAAKLVESVDPRWSSLLVTATRFTLSGAGSSSFNAPALVRRILGEAAERASDLARASVLRWRRVGIIAGVSSALVFAFVSAAFAVPTFQVALQRNLLLSTQDWPLATRLVLSPSEPEVLIPQGDDLEIRVKAEGVVPDRVDLVVTDSAGHPRTITTTSIGASEFRYEMSAVQEEVEIVAIGGDGRAGPLRVKLTQRPEVTHAAISITPPAYSGRPAETLPNGRRRATVLRGTRVEVTFSSSVPVVKAEARLADGQSIPATGTNEQWQVALEPQADSVLDLVLEDANGLANRKSARILIQTVEDRPPKASLTLDTMGDMVTTSARIPLKARLEDDLGLGDAMLVVAIHDAEAAREPLRSLVPGQKQFNVEAEWDLTTKAPCSVGDVLTFRVEAEDLNDVTGPGRGRSAGWAVRLVTPDELLKELLRREQEYRFEFSRTIKQQEDLRRRILTDGPAILNESNSETASILATHERTQRAIASSAASTLEKFRQTSRTMKLNRLGGGLGSERLDERIIIPLDVLIGQHLPSTLEELQSWANNPNSAEAANRVDAAIEVNLEQMQRCLSGMLQSEGYYEAVQALQELIELQKKLAEETKARADEGLKDIFSEP